jgi:hypothetical protein
MKDKIKDFSSKYKGLNQETKSAYFYGVLFLFLLVFGVILKFTGKLDRPKNTNTPTNNDTKEVNKLDCDSIFNKTINNYKEYIVIQYDNKKSFVDIENFNNELYINYVNLNDQTLNGKYFKSNDTLYVLNNNKYEEIDTEIKDIDLTFISPKNILELINANTYKKDNKYMIETSAWINLYNIINNKQLEKIVTGEIEVNVISCKENIKVILDLTNLYKNLNYDYKKVIYDITFYDINLETE